MWQNLNRFGRFAWWTPGIVLVIVALAVVIASLGDKEQAVAKPTEYSLCNVFLTAVPADVEVGVRERPVSPGETKIYLVAYIPILAEGLPAPIPGETPTPVKGRFIGEVWINGEWIESHIVIDPETGDVVEEYYNPERPADRGKLGAVKNSLIVGQPSPSVPAWPRTDTPPGLDRIQLAVPDDFRGLKYRPPEAGSGMITSHIKGSSEEQPFWQVLKARTCESTVVVEIDKDGNGKLAEKLEDTVVPEERAMFERFLSEVEGLASTPTPTPTPTPMVEVEGLEQ